MTEETPESLLERITAILPPKYRDLTTFKEEIGGTREIFIANWGRNGERKVAIKVDKSPRSKNAEYHAKRGYTTSHEIDISLKIDPKDALTHNIIPLVDYYEKDGLVVSVEPWFEGSKSLRKIIDEQGTLTPLEFEQVFSQVLEAERFLIKDKGLYHRDLNPSNILIRKEGKKLEARITDLANACSINEVTAKPRPTAGARLITDPCLGSVFTGTSAQYDQRSEIYALGVNMLLALTGKTAFEYDIDNGTAIQHYEGIRSVLDKEGKLDCLAHNWILGNAVDKIPWRARKFREIIHWCMIAERDHRISSIDELIERFNETKESSLLGKIIVAWKGISAVFLVGSIAAGYTNYLSTQAEALESQLEQATKYKVVAAWNGRNLEISNNLVDMNVSVFASNTTTYFPRERFVVAQPGDRLSIHVGLRSKPEPNEGRVGYNSFVGKVYLEGFSGNNFYVTPASYDQAYYEEVYLGGDSSLVIPDNLLDGTYMLAAEIYSPDDSKFTEEKRQKSPYHFDQSGKIISRKRIPIVVGKPEEAVYNLALRLDTFAAGIEFRNVGDDGTITTYSSKNINKEIAYEIGIPKLEPHQMLGRDQHPSNLYEVRIILPSCKEKYRQHILVALAKLDEKIISSTYLPIETKPINDTYCTWKLVIPGREFSEEIEQYRQDLFAHE